MSNPSLEPEQVETPDPLDDLEPDLRADVELLIAQGYLVDDFSFGGHAWTLRTLSAKEGWAAAAATQPYKETLREVQVFMAATIGLALLAVDGDPNFHIQLTDALAHAKQRLDYVGNFDDVIIDYLYGRYNKLDQRRIAARRAIGNLLLGDRHNFSPFAASSTVRDIFSDGTPPGNLS